MLFLVFRKKTSPVPYLPFSGTGMPCSKINSCGICNRMPAPSPVLLSAPSAPRCRMFSNILRLIPLCRAIYRRGRLRPVLRRKRHARWQDRIILAYCSNCSLYPFVSLTLLFVMYLICLSNCLANICYLFQNVIILSADKEKLFYSIDWFVSI